MRENLTSGSVRGLIVASGKITQKGGGYELYSTRSSVDETIRWNMHILGSQFHLHAPLDGKLERVTTVPFTFVRFLDPPRTIMVGKF
jgi:hypothetical protein